MRNVLKINDATEVQLIKQGTFRYVQQMCEEGIGIRYGSMISSYVEAEVFYGLNDISAGDVLYYYRVRDVDNTFTPLGYDVSDLIGIFTVETVTKGKKSYSFVAYDDIHKLDVDYSQELLSMKNQFPMRVEDFLDAVETYASGIGLNIAVGDLTAYTMSGGNPITIDYFYAEGITLRDVLKYFSAISFRYARCTPDGYIHFPYVEKFDTEGQWAWLSADRYIISPTDQITYTGTADIGGVPTTVNLIPVFYKENGLSVGDYSFVTPGCCEVRGMNGEVIYNTTNGSLSDGSYIISNNVAASKIENDPQWWQDVVDSQYGALCNLLTNNSVVPFEVHLFPFRNPFFAGQLLPHIVDTDGTRYQSVIMKMEQTDFEVILTCSGAEKYYDDSSKNYDIADETTSNSVAINDLKESIGNKVSKTGDSMTGELVVKDAAVSVQDTVYGRTALPSSTRYRYLQFLDKARNILGAVRSVLTSTGRSGVYIYGTNGNVANGIGLYVEADGTRVLSLSDVALWLNQLGLGTSGVLPVTIAQGGTGATSAAAALENFGLGSLQAEQITISNGGSGQFSVPNSSRGLIISAGSNNATKDMFLYNCTSTGTVSYVKMGTSTGITITTTTNKITIANSGGSQTVVCKISY